MQMSFLDEHSDSRLKILEHKLKEDIGELQRRTLTQGQNGSYCKLLSDLIVKYVNDCTNEIKTDIFNKIKSGKILPTLEFDEIKANIEQKVYQVLKTQLFLFKDGVSKTFSGDEVGLRASLNIPQLRKDA